MWPLLNTQHLTAVFIVYQWEWFAVCNHLHAWHSSPYILSKCATSSMCKVHAHRSRVCKNWQNPNKEAMTANLKGYARACANQGLQLLSPCTAYLSVNKWKSSIAHLGDGFPTYCCSSSDLARDNWENTCLQTLTGLFMLLVKMTARPLALFSGATHIPMKLATSAESSSARSHALPWHAPELSKTEKLCSGWWN